MTALGACCCEVAILKLCVARVFFPSQPWLERPTGAISYVRACFTPRPWLNPLRTAVPFWGQTSQVPSSMSPKRDCGTKSVEIDPSKQQRARSDDAYRPPSPCPPPPPVLHATCASYFTFLLVVEIYTYDTKLCKDHTAEVMFVCCSASLFFFWGIFSNTVSSIQRTLLYRYTSRAAPLGRGATSH